MRGERGAAALLGVAAASLLMLIAVATAGVGVLYAARTQAVNAADASALAAAVATYPPAATRAPRAAAGQAAQINGAALERCDCRIDPSLNARTVHVVVSIGVELPILGRHVVEGRARAEFDPRAWLGRTE